MFANWRTTLAGWVAGAGILIGAHYQSGMTFTAWATAVGVALIGTLSKDFNVTGGSVQQ